MRTPVCILVLAGCAKAAALPPVRFMNAPPAVAVNDRHDVPEPPAEREFVRWLYNFDGQFHRRVTRALELHRPRRALGVNALDEVPNSTWFTNRIGVRDISPAEIAAERAHSQADNMARVQAEMLAMKQEMAELRAMMANNPNVKAMNAKDAPKAKVAPAGVAETNIVPVAEADAVDAPVAGR